MYTKRYLLCSVLFSSLIVASDTNVGGFDDFEPQGAPAPLDSGPIIPEPDALAAGVVTDITFEDEKGVTTESDVPQLEDLPEEVQHQIQEALTQFGFSAAAATALLNNSFGRMVLIAFLGYKSFNSFRKAFRDKFERNTHIAKAFGYLIAAGMLSQDGYTWLLNR